MDEKKSIKVSLGTSICIFIIIVLIVALGVVYYLGYVKNNQEIIALKNEVSVLKENNNIISNEKESSKTNKDATNSSIIGTYKLDKDNAKKLDSNFISYDCKVVFNDNSSCSIYGGEYKYEGDTYNNIYKGTYSVNENTIVCNMERDIVFKFNIIDANTIELNNVNTKITNGEPNVPVFKVGTRYTSSSIENSNDETKQSNTYKELTNNLSQNEMFGLINISKNTNGTYTLYGGIYEKINSTSAKLSNDGYRKVVVSEDTKYIDYYGKETTIKGIYNDNNFPREDNELSSTIYANSTWLLKFEFSQSKCTLIEETNLAT